MAQQDGYRLVHFDLKGAPPKVNYFQEVFPLLKKWGANGVLLEYEDMFPYSGELKILSRPEAYSQDDICTIKELAEENGFIVIPLVQTFGHFEFVLKHAQFAGLREVPDQCRALCPSNPESLRIVKCMVDQVLSLHPAPRWFHIGADEVYPIGGCEGCKRRMDKDRLTPENLFISHVMEVLKYIKSKSPGTQLIMWDDMFRQFHLDILTESGLGSMVEPMVWHYQPSEIPVADIWSKYSKVFPNIWLGSAFKGATGIYQFVIDITYHLGNHMMWLSVLQKEAHKFQHIRGVALTGWQRYDHLTVLCELFPSALPSLGLCLQTLQQGYFTARVHEDVSTDLNCSSLVPLNPFQLPEIPCCKFPGSEIYMQCLQLIHLDAELEFKVLRVNQEDISTTNNDTIKLSSQRLVVSYEELMKTMSTSLSSIYFPNTVEEWLSTYLTPKLAKIKEFL